MKKQSSTLFILLGLSSALPFSALAESPSASPAVAAVSADELPAAPSVVKLPPRLTERVAPVVSSHEAAGLTSARFMVEATIDKNGRVLTPNVVESKTPGLDRAVERAVSQWSFEPATANGQPITVVVHLPVEVDFTNPSTELVASR